MSGNDDEKLRGTSFTSPRTGPQIEELELASRTILIQNKRFYLDVKQNNRGRFVKITEVGVGGQKSRILMSVPAANELKEKVEKLNISYEKLAPHNPKSLAADGLIESETVVRDNRRYYLDLRENERGRYLRVSMLSMGVRVHIALPAEGMVELQNALSDLIQNHCTDEDLLATQDLPEAKVLFAGNKTFYFDVGSNRYGVFLRISELRANYRTAVTIPEHHWSRFRDILSELSNKLELTKSEHARENAVVNHSGQAGGKLLADLPSNGGDKTSVAGNSRPEAKKKQTPHQPKPTSTEKENSADLDTEKDEPVVVGTTTTSASSSVANTKVISVA